MKTSQIPFKLNEFPILPSYPWAEQTMYYTVMGWESQNPLGRKQTIRAVQLDRKTKMEGKSWEVGWKVDGGIIPTYLH